jgi:hypothetical protein
MIRLGFLLAPLVLAGCRPDVTIEQPEGITADDLARAYTLCVGYENRQDFDKRLACTAAVYGGRN